MRIVDASGNRSASRGSNVLEWKNTDYGTALMGQADFDVREQFCCELNEAWVEEWAPASRLRIANLAPVHEHRVA